MILSDSDRQDDAVITSHFVLGLVKQRTSHFNNKMPPWCFMYVVKKKFLQGSVPSVCKFIAHMTQQKEFHIFTKSITFVRGLCKVFCIMLALNFNAALLLG